MLTICSCDQSVSANPHLREERGHADDTINEEDKYVQSEIFNFEVRLTLLSVDMVPSNVVPVLTFLLVLGEPMAQ